MSDIVIDAENIKNTLSILSERGDELAKEYVSLYPKRYSKFDHKYADSEIDPDYEDYLFGARFEEPCWEGEEVAIMFPIENLVSREAMRSRIQQDADQMEKERLEHERLMAEREKEEQQKRAEQEAQKEQKEREEYERLKQKFGGGDE